MTPKEKLIWLATNANEDFSNVECAVWLNKVAVWLEVTPEMSFGCLLDRELRLTQSEMEKRNPGWTVVEWYGREPKYSGRPLPENEKVVDGWLLRRKVRRARQGLLY